MKNQSVKIMLSLVLLILAVFWIGCNDNSDPYAPSRTERRKPTPPPKVEPVTKSQPAPRASSSSNVSSGMKPNPITTQTTAEGNIRSTFAFPTGYPETSVMLIVREAPSQVRLSYPFEYQISVSNLTNAPLEGVQLTEPLAGTFDFNSATPAPTSQAQGVLAWNLGTLKAKETRKIAVRGKANKVGKLSDCITISYKPKSCLSITVVEPALKLAKTGPAEVLICDPIAYTLTVSNQGSGDAQNVVIQDKLPKGLVTTADQNTYRVNVGTLKSGETKSFKVNLKATETGKFVNEAVATGAGGLTSSASHTLVVKKPVLTVAKTGPAKRYLDRNADYVITVENKGDGAARDTVVVDTLPAGMQFVSASQGGVHQSGKVTWKLGILAPGTSKQIVVRAKAAKIGVQRNVANVTAYCASGSAQTTTEVVGIPAILLEVADLEDPIEVGANETYVIEVTNQGSAPGTNIKITCTISDEQQYVSGTGPTQPQVAGKVINFAPLPMLAAKAKATYRLVVKGTKPGDIRFKVEMISDQMSSSVMETESTHQYE
jgi:uncharacterized repeat protein (TIGR01451 family)